MADGTTPLVELRLLGLQVQVPTQYRVMLLREIEGDERVLPIVIDDPEAQAIYRGVERIEPPRPLTHELIRDIIDQLGANVACVTITEMIDRTFLANLELDHNGRRLLISARPSDAVAVAVRCSAPIFASPQVMSEAGQVVEIQSPSDASEDVDQEELVKEFQDFLSDVSADDFNQPDEDAP